MPRRRTQEEVIAGFREVHGEYYNYSHVEYVNSGTKVKVGCPVHGEFTITAGHHRAGVGCRKCYFTAQKISKDEFIARAQRYFGDHYDYTRFDAMPPGGVKVPIYCPSHDQVFWQEPRSHIQGHTGCPGCLTLKLAGPHDQRGTLSSEDALTRAFIARAKERHGNAYDYAEFHYVNGATKGKILCPIHGAFWQTPSNHLRGTKCPACSHERRKVETFKRKCQQLGVDYWRALKRREAGLPEEKIFEEGSLRDTRETNPITVWGVTYPNLEEAIRVLHPPASAKTIIRWVAKALTPEQAFTALLRYFGCDGLPPL